MRKFILIPMLALLVTTISVGLLAQAQDTTLEPITADNISRLTLAYRIGAHDDDVNTLGFSPDSTLLATAGDGKEVILWEARTQAELARFDQNDDVNLVEFSDDGILLFVGGDFDDVYAYATDDYEQQGRLPGDSGSDTAIDTYSNLVAVGNNDGGFRIWSYDAAGELTELLHVEDAHSAQIQALEFSPDGTMLATASEDDDVKVWTIDGISLSSAPVDTSQPASPAEQSLPTPEGTPLPPGFPTPTRATIRIAEQVFENGRMLWVQPTGQIWVMTIEEEGSGAWAVYDDTFVEGEDPEIDPALEPPADLIQPERGFGKLWRENPDIRDTLGWAITPEFGYDSQYGYYPGGTMDGGQYVAGPGYHLLFSLYGEAFRFDEATGTWRLDN